MRLTHVLETVLYYEAEEREEILRFYRDVLRLDEVDEELAFRLGDGLVLLFDADAASRQERPPPHGARGAVHTCFVAGARWAARGKDAAPRAYPADTGAAEDAVLAPSSAAQRLKA